VIHKNRGEKLYPNLSKVDGIFAGFRSVDFEFEPIAMSTPPIPREFIFKLLPFMYMESRAVRVIFLNISGSEDRYPNYLGL